MFRFASIALLAVGVLAASPALAVRVPVPATPSPRPPSDYYPDRATKAHVEAWVKVQCTIQMTGRLGECVVLTEAPMGYGFGAAAVKSALEMGVVDLRQDGPGKKVTRTLRFTFN